MPDPAVSPIEVVERLFISHGGLRYGENVTQLEHALQCATLAYESASSPALVVAALLHDIGHMLHKDAASAYENSVDDHHETLGAKWLNRYFCSEVVEPVAWHVQAKRYLCSREAPYWAALSEASKKTLVMQGGPMKESEAAAFEQLGCAEDAIAVRRWDDFGKRTDGAYPPLQQFLDLLPRVLKPAADRSMKT